MINIKTSTPSGHMNTRQLSINTVSTEHFCHPVHDACTEKGSIDWKKKGGKKKKKTRLEAGLYFPHCGIILSIPRMI